MKVYLETIQFAGTTRSYTICIPSFFPLFSKVPLFVGLHGGVSNGDQFRYQCQMDATIDKNKFVVVYPNGMGRLGKYTFNAGDCCGPARDKGIDDVGFLKLLVSTVSKKYKIDLDKVFAFGFSNGGMMAYRLALEASDVFKGFGIVGGMLTSQLYSKFASVPIIHIHGMKDTHVPYEGGIGDTALDPVEYHYTVPELAEIFAPNVLNIVQNFTSSANYLLRVTANNSFQLVSLPEGGHQWPGGNDINVPNGGTLVKDVNATQLIYSFLTQPQGTILS